MLLHVPVPAVVGTGILFFENEVDASFFVRQMKKIKMELSVNV